MDKSCEWILVLTSLLMLLHYTWTAADDCGTFKTKATACIITFVGAQDGDALQKGCEFKCSDFSTSTQCVNDIGGTAQCVLGLAAQINLLAAAYSLPCTYEDMQKKCPSSTKLVIPGATTVAEIITTPPARAAGTAGRHTASKGDETRANTDKTTRASVTVAATKKGKSVSSASSLAVGTVLYVMSGTLVLVRTIS